MFSKSLLILLFLVSAQSQDDKKEEEDLSCTLDDGSIGECVPFYLCNANKTINDEGLGVIDIRGATINFPETAKFRAVQLYRAGDDEGGCKSYMDSCCMSEDKQETPVTKVEPMEQRQGCGWRNPKGVIFSIIGDVDGEANFGEFPWMVAVLKVELVDEAKPTGTKLSPYLGGGSLINPNVVLSAAHYVATNSSFRIRAGEWDTQTTKEIYPHQERDVISKEIHANFHPGTLFFDIALLFLEKPVEMAQHVGFVCLPPPKQITADGTRCFATGWGKDKFGKGSRYQTLLKKIDVPVVERNACQLALRKTRLGRHFKLHTSFMCAGGEKDKDTCKGDGGSPLACPMEQHKDRYMQSGIVAWGIGCGEEGIPGVYADVAYLRNWIDEKVIKKGYDPKTYTI